jgi:hypothetical protein
MMERPNTLQADEIVTFLLMKFFSDRWTKHDIFGHLQINIWRGQ